MSTPTLITPESIESGAVDVIARSVAGSRGWVFVRVRDRVRVAGVELEDGHITRILGVVTVQPYELEDLGRAVAEAVAAAKAAPPAPPAAPDLLTPRRPRRRTA